MMRDLIVNEDLEFAMKVIIVGNGSVGKSSMIQRFCRGVFTRDYKKTIGVDFLERILTIQGQNVRLMLWDTAGQEEFDAITRTYYRGASACILTCSITDKNSVNAIPVWKTKVCRECGDDLPIVLVANKCDLQKQAIVDTSALEELTRSLGISRLFSTSVKEDTNILALFTYLAETFMSSVMTSTEEDRLSPAYRLIEDGFNSTLDDESNADKVVLDNTDVPHHKFHTPVFGQFRTKSAITNGTNNPGVTHRNNKDKSGGILKLWSGKSKVNDPLLKIGDRKSGIRSISNEQITALKNYQNKVPPKIGNGFLYPSSTQNYRKFGGIKDSQHYFSSNGNHYTHWENRPFRLQAQSNGPGNNQFKKVKKDFCNIL